MFILHMNVCQKIKMCWDAHMHSENKAEKRDYLQIL